MIGPTCHRRRTRSFRAGLQVTTNREATLRTWAERQRGHPTNGGSPSLVTDNEPVRWAGEGGVPVSSGSEVKFVANLMGPDVSGRPTQMESTQGFVLCLQLPCVCLKS